MHRPVTGTHVNLIVDWFDQLKATVPAGYSSPSHRRGLSSTAASSPASHSPISLAIAARGTPTILSIITCETPFSPVGNPGGSVGRKSAASTQSEVIGQMVTRGR